jgi:hypothetical protein
MTLSRCIGIAALLLLLPGSGRLTADDRYVPPFVLQQDPERDRMLRFYEDQRRGFEARQRKEQEELRMKLYLLALVGGVTAAILVLIMSYNRLREIRQAGTPLYLLLLVGGVELALLLLVWGVVLAGMVLHFLREFRRWGDEDIARDATAVCPSCGRCNLSLQVECVCGYRSVSVADQAEGTGGQKTQAPNVNPLQLPPDVKR